MSVKSITPASTAKTTSLNRQGGAADLANNLSSQLTGNASRRTGHMSIANKAGMRAEPGGIAWIGSAPRPACDDTRDVVFDDSDDFLLSPQPFDFDFYVVAAAQRGVRGLDLIRLIRRRSSAGLIALSETGDDDFAHLLDAGADMVVSATAPAAHLVAAIAAVRRRTSRPGATSTAAAAQPGWQLRAAEAVLQAPDGTRIALSESDLLIMNCLAAAEDRRVDRRQLVEALWGADAGAMDNALHATVYRLRKRIENAGQVVVPVHAVARFGYEFRAPLSRA